MASRRLQHLAEQPATAAPRGAAPARALPASGPLHIDTANMQRGEEDHLNTLAGGARVATLARARRHSTRALLLEAPHGRNQVARE
jgi:hypothetical protein